MTNEEIDRIIESDKFVESEYQKSFLKDYDDETAKHAEGILFYLNLINRRADVQNFLLAEIVKRMPEPK